MAIFETESKFTDQLRKIETADPAHADLFNDMIGALLNNDVFLRSELMQQLQDNQTTLDAYYQQSSGYTDQKIAALINGAPSTLDTLGEIAQAMKSNESVVNALDEAIGKKASAAEFNSHVKDATAHITAAERTAWNGKLDPAGNASNVTATFSQASTRANLKSKEKLSVSLGKIMKWFADLADGAASTLLGTNLSVNCTLVTDENGKVTASSVSSTELGYLAGIKSKVQNQIDDLNTDLGTLTNKKSTSLQWMGINIGIRKYGKLVEFRVISGTLTSELTSYKMYTVGSIEEGFRPVTQMTKIIWAADTSAALLNINTNGAVEFTPYTALAKGYTPMIAEIYVAG